MTRATGTQAVDRAAELLSLIVGSDTPRTFTSLVDETGLAKSTVSRLLQALERHRLIQRGRDGAFRAGPVFALYAARHDSTDDLVELAMPTMERIGEQTAETVVLAVPRAGSVAQIAQVDSSHLLGATNWVGSSVPGHCSALGKVFYAYGALPLPSGELKRRTPATITSRAELERDLATVVRRGYAVAWEELEPGLVAIAGPVRGDDGSVVAAISVSGPTARISEESAQQFGELLVAEGQALSSLLGHQVRKEGAA